MSENKIKCPNCGTQINVDELLFHQAEEKLNEKQKLANIELQKKEEAIKQQQIEFEEKRIKAQEEYKQKLEADRKDCQRRSGKSQPKSKRRISVKIKITRRRTGKT